MLDGNQGIQEHHLDDIKYEYNQIFISQIKKKKKDNFVPQEEIQKLQQDITKYEYANMMNTGQENAFINKISE